MVSDPAVFTPVSFEEQAPQTALAFRNHLSNFGDDLLCDWGIIVGHNYKRVAGTEMNVQFTVDTEKPSGMSDDSSAIDFRAKESIPIFDPRRVHHLASGKDFSRRATQESVSHQRIREFE